MPVTRAEQKNDKEKPGISGGFVENALDFTFFHKDIPNVAIEATTGTAHKGKTYFVLIYKIGYSPKGIATFPDGGMPRYELERLYLFSRDNATKALANLGEIKYPYLSYRNPGLFVSLAACRENILISAYFEDPKPKLKSWKSILSYNISDKTLTEFIRDASLPRVSPDEKKMIFYRGDDIILYDLDKKTGAVLMAKVYGLKWADSGNILFQSKSSDRIMSLNITDKKIVSTGILKKKITPLTFFKDENKVLVSEAKAIVSDLAFFEENGLPDPVPFVRGSKRENRLLEIAASEAGHFLRLAIVAKFLRENRRDLVDKILSGLDNLCEKKISTGNNRIIADMIRKDIAGEKAVIKKIAENYTASGK